jgi:hypothetical protein
MANQSTILSSYHEILELFANLRLSNMYGKHKSLFQLKPNQQIYNGNIGRATLYNKLQETSTRRLELNKISN